MFMGWVPPKRFTNSASAILQFYKEFAAKYVDGSTDKAFVKAATDKKTRCFVCHDPTKIDGKVSKKNRNAYGQELSKLLDKKADKKDLKKIREALLAVESMKSDSKDSKSPTFGELISSGKILDTK